jgi:hypothetical protein
MKMPSKHLIKLSFFYVTSHPTINKKEIEKKMEQQLLKTRKRKEERLIKIK